MDEGFRGRLRAGAAKAVRVLGWLAGGRLRERLRERRLRAALEACGLFDPAAYLDRYPDVARAGVPPALHYLEYGDREGRRPHPLFEPEYYLARNPDVARSGAPSLLHYAGHGEREGRQPNPYFDPAFYARRNPDLPRRGVPLLEHFFRSGAREGRRPHPWFDPAWYLARNPDVARSGLNPLDHYLRYGEAEGRKPVALFDPAWYRARNPDVARSPMRPLEHYLEHGMAEGRPPCAAAESVFGGRVPPADPLIFPAASAPEVSILVPVHDQWLHTLWCLRSVLANTRGVDYEVIVADDASADETRGLADRARNVRHLRRDGSPLRFLENCNRAAREARGRYIAFLNNDTLVHPGWLEAMVRAAEAEPAAGVVGAKLLFPDGTLQEAGAIVWDDGTVWNFGRGDDPRRPEYNYVRETDYVSGAAMLVRRDLWERVGGFDGRYAPCYYEDADLAFEARKAGFKVLVQPAAEVVHFEGISNGADPDCGIERNLAANRLRFREKWADALRREHLPYGRRVARARDRSLGKRRVLVVDHRLPDPDQDAGSLRMVHFLRLLRERDCRVTFVPADLAPDPVLLERLRQGGVETPPSPWVASVPDFLRKEGPDFDLVVLSRVSVAGPLADPVRRFCPRAFVVFDTVDLHFLRAERRALLTGDRADREEAEALRRRELESVRKSDLTLVVSPVELERLLREAPGARVGILPTVCEARGKGAPFRDRRDLFFLGGFEHPPNADAVLWFAREVFPRIRSALPEARFLVVGSKVPPEVAALHRPGEIEVLGHVKDLEPVAARCRLSVAPLRFGAGVKGKINVSQSWGTPVVATPLACEGMHLLHGRNALIAEDAGGFAEAVCRAYRDETLWTRLSEGGLDNVRRRFSPAAAGRAVDALLRRADRASASFFPRDEERRGAGSGAGEGGPGAGSRPVRGAACAGAAEPAPQDEARRLNAECMAFESLLGRAELRARPWIIVFEPTNRCNFRGCLTCYRSIAPLPPRDFEPGEMDMPLLQGFLDTASQIYFSGTGEPMLAPAFDRLLRMCRRGGARVAVITNGSLLDRLDPGFRDAELTISLDGATKSTFEFIRKGADFERIVRSIGRLDPLVRTRVKFSPTMCRLNAAETGEFVRLAVRLGIGGVDFQEFYPYLPWHGTMALRDEDRAVIHGQFEASKPLADGAGCEIVNNVIPPDPGRPRSPGAARPAPEEMFAETERAFRASLADSPPSPEPEPAPARAAPPAASEASEADLPTLRIESLRETVDSLAEELRARDRIPLPSCMAPYNFIFVHAWGATRPCCQYDRSTGSLRRDQPGQDPWNGPAVRDLRRQLAAGRNPGPNCPACMHGSRMQFLETILGLLAGRRIDPRRVVIPDALPPLLRADAQRRLERFIESAGV